MKLLRKIGSTSQILQIFISDSSSTTGAGLTGLTNASAGLVGYYHRDTDTTATAISLVSMTVGTFTSGGFKEIDSTNMPGWYQFCPPNAALASGAASVGIHLKGATNMAPLPIEIDLDAQVDVTLWNGTAVSAPSTAGIPDVNILNIANAAVSTTTAQIGVNAVKLGNTVQTGRDIGASVLLSPGTGTGQISLASGAVTAGTVSDKTGYSLAQSFPANFAALLISVSGHISNVDTLTTYTGDTPQTGDCFVRLGAPAGASVSADVAAVKVDTAAIATKAAFLPSATAGAAGGLFIAGTNAATSITTGLTAHIIGTLDTVTNLTNAPTAGDLTATMKTSVTTAATAATPTVTVGTVNASASNIKKNTALAGFPFVMTDSTTHAPKTGVTVTATRSLDGGAFGACANAVVEVSSGVYKIDLAASDLNANTVTLRLTGTASDDCDIVIVTQP